MAPHPATIACSVVPTDSPRRSVPSEAALQAPSKITAPNINCGFPTFDDSLIMTFSSVK
jgi:hypothetical protein